MLNSMIHRNCKIEEQRTRVYERKYKTANMQDQVKHD